jgi:hypothetical protein
VKKILRLILFFNAGFIFVLLVFTAINFFHARSDGLTTVVLPGSFLWKFTGSLYGRLPITFYLAILLSLSYAARRGISIPVSMFCVFILAMGWTALASLLIVRTDGLKLPPVYEKSIKLGEKGLVLSSNNGSMVLLDGPEEYPRLIALPGMPFEYQKTKDDPIIRMVPAARALFFRNDESPRITRLVQKFQVAARKFEMLLSKNFMDFMIYMAALAFLLVSMRFIMNLSSWHFANLLFGAVVFTGILYLQVFIDSPRVQNLITAAIKNAIPEDIISPAVFCTLGLFFTFFTAFFSLLSKNARRKRRYNA